MRTPMMLTICAVNMPIWSRSFRTGTRARESVFGRISDDLADAEIPIFEPPSPRPPDPPPEPLFSSSRPYLDQIAAYREWQGKEGLQ